MNRIHASFTERRASDALPFHTADHAGGRSHDSFVRAAPEDDRRSRAPGHYREVALPDITEAALNAADGATPIVLMDLNGTDFFGSSFIELMFRIWNRLKARSGRFAICNLHPYCRQVLQITNLHRIWPLFGSREEALAQLSTMSDDHDPE